jgi:hypothetical protein
MRFDLLVDVTELSVAVVMLLTFERLGIGLQTEPIVPQQPFQGEQVVFETAGAVVVPTSTHDRCGRHKRYSDQTRPDQTAAEATRRLVSRIEQPWPAEARQETHIVQLDRVRLTPHLIPPTVGFDQFACPREGRSHRRLVQTRSRLHVHDNRPLTDSSR